MAADKEGIAEVCGKSGYEMIVVSDVDSQSWWAAMAVSYTHLTLPTILLV